MQCTCNPGNLRMRNETRLGYVMRTFSPITNETKVPELKFAIQICLWGYETFVYRQ